MSKEDEYTEIYKLQNLVNEWFVRRYDSPFRITALTILKEYKQRTEDWPSLAAALPHHKIGDVCQAINNVLNIQKQATAYMKPIQPELLAMRLTAQGIDEETAAAIAATIEKVRELAEEVNTLMGKRAGLYALDRCSGRPSWSENKAYKAPIFTLSTGPAKAARCTVNRSTTAVSARESAATTKRSSQSWPPCLPGRRGFR